MLPRVLSNRICGPAPESHLINHTAGVLCWRSATAANGSAIRRTAAGFRSGVSAAAGSTGVLSVMDRETNNLCPSAQIEAGSTPPTTGAVPYTKSYSRCLKPPNQNPQLPQPSPPPNRQPTAANPQPHPQPSPKKISQPFPPNSHLPQHREGLGVNPSTKFRMKPQSNKTT